MALRFRETRRARERQARLLTGLRAVLLPCVLASCFSSVLAAPFIVVVAMAWVLKCGFYSEGKPSPSVTYEIGFV